MERKKEVKEKEKPGKGGGEAKKEGKEVEGREERVGEGNPK